MGMLTNASNASWRIVSIIFSVMSAKRMTRMKENTAWTAKTVNNVHPMEAKSLSWMPRYGNSPTAPVVPTPPSCPQSRVMASVNTPEMLMMTIPAVK